MLSIITNIVLLVAFIVLLCFFIEKTKRIKELACMLNDKNNEVEVREDLIARLRSRINDFEVSYNTLSGNVEGFKTQIQVYLQKIDKLEKDILSLQSDVDKYIKELSNFPIRDTKTGKFKKRLNDE